MVINLGRVFSVTKSLKRVSNFVVVLEDKRVSIDHPFCRGLQYLLTSILIEPNLVAISINFEVKLEVSALYCDRL